MKFEEYWQENKKDYIEQAKMLALQDFNEKEKAGKKYAIINIETDDDFAFKNHETSFEVYGDNDEDVIKNSIKFLKEIKLEYGNEHKWIWIKTEAIERLEEGESSFSFGGNQTIDYHIHEYKNNLEMQKTLQKKVKP